MTIEWDQDKENYNIREHGLDFSFAELVFASAFPIEVYDRYENGEHRYHTFGLVGQRVLLVVHSYPDEDEDGYYTVVRVFGFRHATPMEERIYERERTRLYGTPD